MVNSGVRCDSHCAPHKSEALVSARRRLLLPISYLVNRTVEDGSKTTPWPAASGSSHQFGAPLQLSRSLLAPPKRSGTRAPARSADRAGFHKAAPSERAFPATGRKNLAGIYKSVLYIGTSRLTCSG